MAYIPAILAMECPAESWDGILMNDGSGAKWRHGSSIEVEGAVQVFFSGEAWIESQGAQKRNGLRVVMAWGRIQSQR
jgi:hypothetical protein